MTTPSANSVEGLQLQLALVKQMLCDEIILLDILLNGANTRQYDKIQNCSDAETITISKNLMETNIEGIGKLETILHYYLLLIDHRRRVKSVAAALAVEKESG